MTSLKNHVEDMKDIFDEYQTANIHQNVRRLYEDRLYLEENLIILFGIYLTSLKTLKRGKKFLKENSYNIVLANFDFFVDFTELSNIYKF